MLALAQRLDIVSIINRHVQSHRPYWPEKPLRNNLTAGAALLLAAIGRVCCPTSKRGSWAWAQTTVCEFLLRMGLSKLDSQHFWDMMDCLPEEAIAQVELECLQKVKEIEGIEAGTLFYDTTNFYTFIDTTNTRCQIAQRTKNKQKRNDLRQVGLALAVTKKDFLPLFHQTYRGNMNDSKVFASVVSLVKKRLLDLGMDLEHHTIVFDRGCNSKKNLRQLARLKLHYVGALTPAHHTDLIEAAEGKGEPVQINGVELSLFREKRVVWGQERTVLVFVSPALKSGQLRGIYRMLLKKKKRLRKMQFMLRKPGTRKRTRDQVEQSLEQAISGPFMEGLFSYTRVEREPGRFRLTWKTHVKKLAELEDRMGFRILMTDRHDWDSLDIVKTYHGQATIEQAFKNIKNPYHLSLKPGFHWTDQKIRVHYFSCVMGYLLATL